MFIDVGALGYELFLSGSMPMNVLGTISDGGRVMFSPNATTQIETGHADPDESTVLHVPDPGMLVAGNTIYDGVCAHSCELAQDSIMGWFHPLLADA